MGSRFDDQKPFLRPQRIMNFLEEPGRVGQFVNDIERQRKIDPTTEIGDP